MVGRLISSDKYEEEELICRNITLHRSGERERDRFVALDGDGRKRQEASKSGMWPARVHVRAPRAHQQLAAASIPAGT